MLVHAVSIRSGQREVAQAMMSSSATVLSRHRHRAMIVSSMQLSAISSVSRCLATCVSLVVRRPEFYDRSRCNAIEG